MVSAFLYSLAAGMLGIVATGRPDQVAWRFLQTIGLIAFAIASGVTAWPFLAPDAEVTIAGNWPFVLGVAVGVASIALVLIAPMAKRAPAIFRVVCGTGAAAGLVAAFLAEPLSGAHPGGLQVSMLVISQILGAALLGSITVAWLLGHAYLTATKMTTAPLRHFSRMLLWSVRLRVAFAVVSLLVAWLAMGSGDAGLIAHLSGEWIVLSLRLGLGLVGVGVFAYMVADCVRLRATQSATGILYFGSLFAYVGELAHQYMIAHYGWPI